MGPQIALHTDRQRGTTENNTTTWSLHRKNKLKTQELKLGRSSTMEAYGGEDTLFQGGAVQYFGEQEEN